MYFVKFLNLVICFFLLYLQEFFMKSHIVSSDSFSILLNFKFLEGKGSIFLIVRFPMISIVIQLHSSLFGRQYVSFAIVSS